MSITAIKRDFSDEPNIVRIISTDALATISANDYLTAQAANISLINNGPFEWSVSDMVLVYATDGWDLFTISSDFQSLTPFLSNSAISFQGTPVIGNLPKVADLNGDIQDSGISTLRVLRSSFDNPDINANIPPLVVRTNIINGTIVSGVVLFTPAAGSTYILLNAQLFVSTTFSGGSTNANLLLNVGGTNIATIPSTTIKAAAQGYNSGGSGFPITALFGTNISTANPLQIPATSSDYTGGSCNLSFLVQRVS